MHIRIKNEGYFRGSSRVTDETGKEIYFVKGKLKMVSPTRKKFIRNMDGEKLYVVRNSWVKWLFNSAIIKDKEGNKMKLKCKMSFNRPYQLEGSDEAYAIGKNPERRGRAIFKNDEMIATIEDWNSGIIMDTFDVECFDEKNLEMVVMLIIAFDNIKDKDSKDTWNK